MSCREQGPGKDRGRERSRDGIQRNWPKEATAVKIEGLVTNSASMLIAIQSSLLCGERRLNPMKEKQTCYRLLNRKKQNNGSREKFSEYQVQNPIHCSCIHVIRACLGLSHCSSVFIAGKQNLDFFYVDPAYQICFYNTKYCEIDSDTNLQLYSAVHNKTNTKSHRLQI